MDEGRTVGVVAVPVREEDGSDALGAGRPQCRAQTLHILGAARGHVDERLDLAAPDQVRARSCVPGAAIKKGVSERQC